MYKNVIQIREEVPKEDLSVLSSIAEGAFNNRAGKVENVSDSPYQLVFQGGENDYGCLEIGMLKLKKEATFLEHLSGWQWVDEDPDECCDLLKLFIKKR